MKRFVAAALTAGIVTASCAGHAGGPLPQMGTAAQGNGSSIRQAALAAAPAGWANTNTRALSIVNATDLGTVPASQSITVRLGLALHNKTQLAQAVASGQQIADSTFMATYAPTSTEVSAVTGYLQSHGFSNVSVSPDHLLVSATATGAHVQSAFNTSIHAFSGGGTNFIANITPAYVPQSLGGIVVSVLGLNNMQAYATKQKPTNCTVKGVSTPPQACLRWYDPATFQIAYDVGNVPADTSAPIAIMAEGNVTQAISDFRLNELKDNLPQVPVNVVQVGLAGTDTAGNGEWTMDMTYSTGIAQKAPALYLYDTTSLTDSDIANEFNAWVTQHKTNVASASFGGCEFFPFLDGSMVLVDEVLVEAAAKGMTMFASSGDNGGYCNNFVDTNGVPGGGPFVMYPASSPYIVAAGGSELYTNADGTYKGEDVWPAGGGGLSQFEYAPYWEAQAQPVAANAASMRGVPDVAMDAGIGPLGNAIVYSNAQAVNGGSCTSGCVTGGTSLSSPLSAGIWARLQSAHGNRLGFAAIRYYRDYSSHAAGAVSAGPPPTRPDGGFHDLLAGSNGLYTAAPGYDYATGLGSFDVSVLSSQI